MLDRAKKFVPLRIKRSIISFFSQEEMILPLGSRAFIFLAADYGNIGDLAITAAQNDFLESYSNFSNVVRVPISKTNNFIRSIKKQINKNDLITIVGGGNMGSLYPDIEELRQLIIRSFPENRIVCFPQSLDWENSTESKKALERIRYVYSRHRDLHVFARESVTKEKLKTLFRDCNNVNVGYAPDIVLSSTKSKLGCISSTAASGILLCLRNDRERALNDEKRAELTNVLASAGHAINFTDTHFDGSRLNEVECVQLVANKINQFAAAKLVVTDRLHGMILSVIAGTPCLVLPNSNHKIQQTWKDWLSNVPQLKFIEPNHIAEMPSFLIELLNARKLDLDGPPIQHQNYEDLKRAIKKL